MNNELNSLRRCDVHRLCSAQVIASPASAVKELIENAVDAGANNIEIRLTEYGLNRIEVRDNGCGIDQGQFALLSRKHHTSKLEEFSDLESITSFGFRGEALSSLCFVCDLVIITRSKNSEIGHRLEFDNEGEIASQSLESRESGTSVILTNFFKTLPVRQKELKRNARKEYNQLLKIVQSYALVSTQIKILCTNQIKQKAPSVVVSTIAQASFLENISCIFGHKIVDYLAPLDLTLPHGKITGFISKSPEDSSRVSGDRQFFFLNQRPVELPKIKKLLNSVFRSESCASKSYSPVAFLHFLLPQNRVDVNLTPDKRSVLLQDEQEILEILQTNLLELWEQNRSLFKVTTHVESNDRKGGDFFLEFIELVEKEEEKMIDSDFITRVKPLSVKKAKTEHKAIETSTEHEVIETSTEHEVTETSTDHEVKETSKECEIIKTSTEPEFIETSTVLKRKTPEMKLDDSVFKNGDVGDLGPTPQKTIPKLNLTEIKNHLTQELVPDNSPHTYQRVFYGDQEDQEMDRIFDKASFQDLDVIGQFNLGFIIAKHDSDVYIIDQHASDEKATFERLMETTRINKQPLINPFSLHLSPVEADIIRSHVDLFDRNGFQFEGVEDESTELELVAVPCSQKEVFTESDLFELIHKIQSHGVQDYKPLKKRRKLEKELLDNSIPRPAKVRSILAMRACRASVMIGKPLTRDQMTKIVHKLSGLISPWNCPHGRPTLRHLCIL